MSISDISMLFQFIGGLGMFLYGMNIMADGLQKSAGNKMKQLLGFLTNNRLMAVCVGALITAIIQSSGATTVMVVGFVNAGILNLVQAVGVIMGANIGTTVTSWIVSMSQLGDAFAVMKPAFYAPLILGIGAFLIMFSKSQKKKMAGEIAIGLALLFIGLDFMSTSISPYTNAPIFSQAFALLGGNPILGMLIGAIVTAILQSSSASVGIMQTLAMNGIVTTNAAVYLTLGQNIGSCVTALLSSVGANKTAKRAAIIHLLFNVIGSLIFGILAFVLFLFNKQLATSSISTVQISIFHTIFNITNTVILFPFAKALVKISGMIVKENPAEKEGENAEEIVAHKHLDDRILESPAFAVESAINEVIHMGNFTINNLETALKGIFEPDISYVNQVYENEKTINNLESILTDYLVKINNLSLTEKQHLIVNNLFYTISDIERVGDHTENIAELVENMIEQNIRFSDTALEDMKAICSEVSDSFKYSIESRQTGSREAVRKVIKIEDSVDNLEEELREKHIERLSNNECSTSTGVIFLDIISNLERVSDHAYNIAGYINDEM